MAWNADNYETITWDDNGNPIYGGFSTDDATDILNAGNWGDAWTPEDIMAIFGDGITSSGLDSMFNDPAMQQYITQVANSPTSSSGLLSSLQSLGTSLGLTSSQLAGLTSAGLGAFLAGSGASPAGETVSKQVPWEAQQPYLKDLFAKAQGQLAGDPMMGAARTNYGSLLAGPTSNPYFGMDNPYLTTAINNAQNDFMRGFQPLVNQANIASGSFGNSGVAQTYGKEAADQLGRISTNMRFQDYTNQQQLGESAANRTANATMGANDFSFAPLQQYGSLIRGNYGGNTSTPYFQNTAANLLGGAMAGSSIYNNLFGAKPTTGA